jgi:hypothetical protein
MVREAGLEPATDGLENHCSIQLSYSRNPDFEKGKDDLTYTLKRPFVTHFCMT